MPAIGITGGISTGKTTFCECLREVLSSAKFCNADEAAHMLLELSGVKREIRAEFGSCVFSNGRTARLRATIWRQKARLSGFASAFAAMEEARSQRPNFSLLISLLYETGGETLCDRVVVVSCSEKMQLARLKKRMSITATEARKMIESQVSLKEKMRRADHVVWNNGDRAVLIEQARFSVALWQGQTWTKKQRH